MRALRKTLVARMLAAQEGVQRLRTDAEAALAAAATTKKDEGNACYKNAQWAEAERAYGEAIAIASTDPVYFCNRSATRQHLGEWAGALEDAAQALELDVNSAKAYGPSRTPSAPCSVRRALLMPQVNAGSRYRSGKSN